MSVNKLSFYVDEYICIKENTLGYCKYSSGFHSDFNGMIIIIFSTMPTRRIFINRRLSTTRQLKIWLT